VTETTVQFTLVRAIANFGIDGQAQVDASMTTGLSAFLDGSTGALATWFDVCAARLFIIGPS
jgi:hypothetical protein